METVVVSIEVIARALTARTSWPELWSGVIDQTNHRHWPAARVPPLP